VRGISMIGRSYNGYIGSAVRGTEQVDQASLRSALLDLLSEPDSVPAAWSPSRRKDGTGGENHGGRKGG